MFWEEDKFGDLNDYCRKHPDASCGRKREHGVRGPDFDFDAPRSGPPLKKEKEWDPVLGYCNHDDWF